MKGAPALAYGDNICDHCGKDETDHEGRPEGGPWGLWCPNPRDHKTKRFYE